MTAAGSIAVVVVVLLVVVAVVWLRRSPRPPAYPERRLLVPFTGGALEPTVLSAAIRIARAEGATLVPAYLLVLPRSLAEDAPATQEVTLAMPLLEAVELEALKAGVPVDARIEKGRTPVHALSRLWEVEPFDRVIAPAPAGHAAGFTPKDLTWILTHAPIEALVLRPGPAQRPSGRSVTLPS